MINDKNINFLINILNELKFDIKLISINKEKKSLVYSSCQYLINNKNSLFRVSKITPKKNGQFVTIWKRNQQNIIVPYENIDQIDFVIILTADINNLGCFIFTNEILTKQNIFSSLTSEGKRGIRIYPKWEDSLSKLAYNSKKWQIKYFIDLNSDKNTILKKIKDLMK